jgi:hypothetical protein
VLNNLNANLSLIIYEIVYFHHLHDVVTIVFNYKRLVLYLILATIIPNLLMHVRASVASSSSYYSFLRLANFLVYVKMLSWGFCSFSFSLSLTRVISESI